MRAEDIFEAVGEIDEEYIDDADAAKPKGHVIKFIVPFAACLCICIVAAVVSTQFRMGNKKSDFGVFNMYDSAASVDDGYESDDNFKSEKSENEIIEGDTETGNGKITDESLNLMSATQAAEAEKTETRTIPMTVEEAQNNTTTETNGLKEHTITQQESLKEEKTEREFIEYDITGLDKKEQKKIIDYAITGLDEKEQKKINVDKSYIESMYGDETGEEYYIVHLDSDNCYYNITITAAMTKVIKTEKFDK